MKEYTQYCLRLLAGCVSRGIEEVADENKNLPFTINADSVQTNDDGTYSLLSVKTVITLEPWTISPEHLATISKPLLDPPAV